MKRLPELARRGAALVLAAGMSLSILMPSALAVDISEKIPPRTASENSVDELGNVELSDETYNVPDEDTEVSTPAAPEKETEQPAEDVSADSHTWGEWQEGTYQEGDDGEVLDVKFRVCADCGVLELEDGTILTPGSGEDLSISDPDQPEWLLPETEPSDIAVYALHGGGHEFNTAWNAGSDDVQYNAGNYRPTCTKTGWGWCRCTKWWEIKKWGIVISKGRCDYWENHTINMAPHTWPSDGTVEQASPCVDGWKVWRCTVCGTELKREKIDAKPHVYGDAVTVAPTCEVGGKTYKKCSVCGYEDVLETTDPLGHHTDGEKWTVGDGSDVGWVVDQPYKCVDGTKTRTCDTCGKTETVTVPATEEHKFTDWVVTKEPTCTENGERQRTCTVCGKVEMDTADGKEIQKLGHDFQNYVDDNKPACCDQYETGTCTRCGVKDTRRTGGPVRVHKFTHYVLATFDGRLATRAYCDYEGCSAYDDKAVSTSNYKENLYVLAATEASETIADYAESVIKQAMRDAETAVGNASTREEAIASLDTIVASVRSQLLNKKVSGEVRIDPGWGSWSIIKLPYSVTVTEAMVGSMLDDLQNGMNSVKEMLNSSFLSKDAIKTLVGKVADTVAKSDDINSSMRGIVYPEAYYQITAAANGGNGSYPGGDSDKAGEKATISNLILQLAGDLVQKDPSSGTDAVQEFLNATFDDLVDMLIEELKKDPDYKKYLDNALGDELLEELRPKLREELVNDTTFMDTIRGIVQNALNNAAVGVKKGWKEDTILANLREDLLKVQDPVEQEMIKLSGTIGDLVESSLTEKINRFLPFGDLTSWIGKWVGAFAKDKAVSEIMGETGTVRDTIEMYIKYITCGEHDRHDRISQNATCTEPEMTENYCSKCGWVFSKTKTGEALGHSPVTVKGYDATETADGLTDGIQCAVCGKWIEPQEVIPAQEPQFDKWLVKADITADTIKAAGYKNQKALDAAIDAALTKAGFAPADSERFLAQVQTSIGILTNDRYPEEGVTGMVKIPAGAAGKNCTFYAVQVLTADTHGYSAGDVVITPLTVTEEGISLKVPVQSVVAIAWKVNE